MSVIYLRKPQAPEPTPSELVLAELCREFNANAYSKCVREITEFGDEVRKLPLLIEGAGRGIGISLRILINENARKILRRGAWHDTLLEDRQKFSIDMADLNTSILLPYYHASRIADMMPQGMISLGHLDLVKTRRLKYLTKVFEAGLRL